MARLDPPSSQTNKPSKPAAIPKPKMPTAQTPPNSIVPLQLKIPESQKCEFKAFAAMTGKPMNALFLEMFEEYRRNHG